MPQVRPGAPKQLKKKKKRKKGSPVASIMCGPCTGNQRDHEGIIGCGLCFGKLAEITPEGSMLTERRF